MGGRVPSGVRTRGSALVEESIMEITWTISTLLPYIARYV
jgi:hypothetical protein